MNELGNTTTVGTFGELLVQLRLLQYGVQAAPPLKDSGNDLIGVKGSVFRAIQVKTRTQDRFDLGDLPDRAYHLLALVALHGKRGCFFCRAAKWRISATATLTLSNLRNGNWMPAGSTISFQPVDDFSR